MEQGRVSGQTSTNKKHLPVQYTVIVLTGKWLVIASKCTMRYVALAQI